MARASMLTLALPAVGIAPEQVTAALLKATPHEKPPVVAILPTWRSSGPRSTLRATP
jgi:hypothetical protein